MKGWPRITAKNRGKAHVGFIDFMILYLANLSKLPTFIALKLNLGPSCKGVKLNTHSTQSQQVDGGGSCIFSSLLLACKSALTTSFGGSKATFGSAGCNDSVPSS